MIREYPHYAVWKNYDRGIFEVVRWDNTRTCTVVQTNIPTRKKAFDAMFTWQKRAREANSRLGA